MFWRRAGAILPGIRFVGFWVESPMVAFVPNFVATDFHY
jgi:hypothetical protein